MIFSRNPFPPYSVVATSFALVLTACGGDSSSSGGSGEESLVDQIPAAFDSAEASTRGELQVALDDAAAEDPDDHEPGSVYRIDVVDNIDSGFDSNGKLEYEGEVGLHIRGASEVRTIDAGEYDGILQASTPELWVEGLRFENGNQDFIVGSGGAINAVSPANDLRVFIINSHFEGNSAAGYGGALSVLGELWIEDSRFKGNTAGLENSSLSGGGAIRAQLSTTIESSEFLNNSEVSDDESFSNGGGALLITNRDLEISNSEFSNNNSATSGGAISVRGARLSTRIVNSDFHENTAETYGSVIASTGAIAEEKDRTLEIENSNFENNEQGSGNAMVYSDAHSGQFTAQVEDIVSTDSSYEGNDAPLLDSENGGLVDGGGNDFDPADDEPDWD